MEYAGIAQITVGDGKAAVDLIGAETGEALEEGTPVAAHRAGAIHHLVVNARKWTIVLQQARERAIQPIIRSAVGMRHYWSASG